MPRAPHRPADPQARLERDLIAFEEGQQALALTPLILAFSAEAQQDVVSQIVNGYKRGDLTTERLWALAGQLVLMDRMQAKLEGAKSRMNQAQQREMSGT
jgi:hypothetical protein